MALNSSGPISLAGTTTGQSIEVELGGTGTTQISLNDTNVRTLAGVPSGAITMPTNFWGKANAVSGWYIASAISQIVPNSSSSTTGTLIGWNGNTMLFQSINLTTGTPTSDTWNGNVEAASNRPCLFAFRDPTYGAIYASQGGNNTSDFGLAVNNSYTTATKTQINSMPIADAATTLGANLGNALWMFGGLGSPYGTQLSKYVYGGGVTNSSPGWRYTFNASGQMNASAFTVTPDQTKAFAVGYEYYGSSYGGHLFSINLSTGAPTMLFDTYNAYVTSTAVTTAAASTNSYFYFTFSLGTNIYIYKYSASLTAPVLQWSKTIPLPTNISVFVAYPYAWIRLFVSSSSVMCVAYTRNSSTTKKEMFVVSLSDSAGDFQFAYRVHNPGDDIGDPPNYGGKQFTPANQQSSTHAFVCAGLSYNAFGTYAFPFANKLADGTYGSYYSITITNSTITLSSAGSLSAGTGGITQSTVGASTIFNSSFSTSNYAFTPRNTTLTGA